MEIKKYAFITALMLGIASGAWAQLGGVHNYMDSSYIPASRMAQQNEWRNNSPSQNFPARPRDQWQLGLYGGYNTIIGDLPSRGGWDAGISFRKALGYVVSVRGSISYGESYGRNKVLSPDVFNLDPNVAALYANSLYLPNYKTQTILPSVDFLFSLNNIMFHKNKSKFNVSLLAGYSLAIYKVRVNALNASNAPYTGTAANIISSLDNTYETVPHMKGTEASIGSYNVKGGFDAGLVVEFKLSDKISLGLEQKFIFPNSDNLDGVAYTGAGYGVTHENFTPNMDNISHTNLSLNFNLGNSKKRVAPLWWLNPLDYLYGETNNPKHTKFPPVVLPDADGDGVTDQFDVEPNTPAGCPVDVHGKSRDTDGDGVPDCRDKELITPTACQPVNADGVGKCPDPECCKDRVAAPKGCQIGDLPSVNFKSGSAKLSKDAEALLMAAAAKIKASPDCKISVIGHGVANKRAQQLSWDHVNAVINYLTEKEGISGDRFVFKYGEEGDPNTVDLRDATGEEGPSTVPAPHPQYQRK